jgi:hypothetical protein
MIIYSRQVCRHLGLASRSGLPARAMTNSSGGLTATPLVAHDMGRQVLQAILRTWGGHDHGNAGFRDHSAAAS